MTSVQRVVGEGPVEVGLCAVFAEQMGREVAEVQKHLRLSTAGASERLRKSLQLQ